MEIHPQVVQIAVLHLESTPQCGQSGLLVQVVAADGIEIAGTEASHSFLNPEVMLRNQGLLHSLPS